MKLFYYCYFVESKTNKFYEQDKDMGSMFLDSEFNWMIDANDEIVLETNEYRICSNKEELYIYSDKPLNDIKQLPQEILELVSVLLIK